MVIDIYKEGMMSNGKQTFFFFFAHNRRWWLKCVQDPDFYVNVKVK